ncbi:MAG: metallophosphatase [Flavobacteriales bacterium]|nr:metallophosphatase [Flavobacteriales bacterium]
MLTLAGLSTLNHLSAASTLKKEGFIALTILHTNDVHSHIDPFEASDPKYPGLGGVVRRAALIDQIRKNKNLLLLDAGDIFQGTPYFNLFKGELEMKLMSGMRYDASTIGNHDFDNGIEGLDKMLPHANFPLINSNYDFADTILNGKVSKTKIFEKAGLKIGVFGVGVELEGLVLKQLYRNTIYMDPIKIANKYAQQLKHEQSCDLVICLSHLGYSYKENKVSDVILAKETENIDLIIGGHTHTFLPEPEVVLNQKLKKTIINQVGWAGIMLGKIDLWIKKSDNRKIFHSNNQFISNKILATKSL